MSRRKRNGGPVTVEMEGEGETLIEALYDLRERADDAIDRVERGGSQ